MGDAYVKAHLDRLELKSKFLVYPRQCASARRTGSKAAYGALTALVKLRNELVHFKSKQFHYTELEKASDHHTELDGRLQTGLVDAVDCVTKVMAELDSLHDHKKSFGKRMQSFIGGYSD